MYIRTQIKGLLDDDRVHCAGSPSQDVIGRLWMDCQYLKASSAKEPIVCKRMEIQKKYICIQIQKHTHVYTHTYKYKLSDYEGIVKTSIPILIRCPLCARECKYKYKCQT